MEIFKNVIGYDGLYQVSNKGNVKSLVNRHGYPIILKQSWDNGGYKIVTLCKNKKRSTKTIHRLVASAFLGQSSLDVNHKDGNKQNNNLENLEFVTKSQNVLHAINIGIFKPNTKKIAENKRKKVSQINNITGEVVATFLSAHDASKKTGFNRGNISCACRLGKLAEGYKWKYIQ